MFHVIQNTCLLRNRSFSFCLPKRRKSIFVRGMLLSHTHTKQREEKKKKKLQHWATTGQPKETTKH